MFYYRVFVSDASYKSSEPLTYSYPTKLKPGAIILVPLKNKLVSGFISSQTNSPEFKTKPIDTVLDIPELPISTLELAEWLVGYYPSSIGIITQQFLVNKLLQKHHILNNDSERILPHKSSQTLTTEQKGVISHIKNPGAYILHGETGSGKTRVYIELAKKVLKQNRSAIILTPEIGLTPQLANTFKDVFGESSVVTTHSQLTEKERTQIWLRVLGTTSPLVIIGPRSALFSPIANVGLVVLDESHEPTYKQDQLPHYHAGMVAAKLASLHNAILILGSATPSIVDCYVAEHKSRPILRMRRLAQASNNQPPTIDIVDIKNRSQFTRSTHLSDALLQAIEKSLHTHRQSLVFLNRRGTARTVLCEQCGWQALCPHCDLPFTYHGDVHMLRCHTCGFKQSAMSFCPVCKNTNIVLKSVGTKAIEDEIRAIFPSASVRRFDADNKKAERLDRQYAAVKAGDVDILVGTQVLAKGLDLPHLNTVGVALADTGLYFPDYTAQERTYQLLRQVIGRVARGHGGDNTVIVQTYDPANAVIKAAVQNSWRNFYDAELDQRRKFTFPPFCFLLKLSCRRSIAANAQSAAQKFTERLYDSGLRIVIDGPIPSFHERVGGKYQWQLIIKAKDRKELVKVVSLLPSGWSYDIDPLGLL
jgi:primosomal protein N' (replication factor Y) (superfamily II helicase)